MPVDDALDDGEADAGAFEVTGRMEPLEGSEKLVSVSHVEACAVVTNEERSFSFGGNDLANLNPGMLCFGRVLPSIAQEVL